MRRFLRLTLLLGALAALGWFLLPVGSMRVAPNSILVVELSGEYIESAEPSLLGKLVGDGRRPFVSLLSELAKAQRDERLAGVVLRVRRLQINWAMAQELRDAIADLSEAGHPTLAYLETGSLGANLEYYVAAAADRIIASPGTSSPVIGLSAQFFFLGGLWEKLGAGVEALGSGEYKSGAETLSGTAMSSAHREMANSLLDSTYAQFVSGIAESRGLSEEFVHQAVDLAPITTRELEGMGLLDGTDSFPEAVRSLGDGPVIKGHDYARVGFASVGFDPVARFALIYGSGTVAMGKGTISRTGGLMLTSDTVSEALDEAATDPEIAAIIFRVDSPGGSPLASDVVWRSVARARKTGKPLIASVSNYAASGGYYVLCGADAIVAPPGSLVGSIGVFAVRPVIAGLLEKLDIGVESMTRGRYAGMLTPSEPLSEGNRERLHAELQVLYDLFVARVSQGRGLDREQVHEVGRGRVWTGAQAAENGLVDELGGLRTAVLRAKEAVGLDPDDDVLLVPFPAPQSLFQELDDALRGAVARALPRFSIVELASRFEPLLTSVPLGTPVLVPPFSVEIR